MPTSTTPALELPTDPAAGFDDADEPRYADYRRLMSHPRVRAYLGKRLLDQGLQYADTQDLISQTYDALWRRRDDEDRPDTLPRMLGLARTALKGKVVDFFRHRAVVAARSKDAPNPKGEAHEAGDSARDQPNYVEGLRPPRSLTPEVHLQAKQQMAFTNQVAAKVGLTDADVETMQALDSDEMTVEEAAKLRGMTPGALRVRLHRIRKKLNEAWRKHSLIRSPTGLMILIVLLLLVYAAVMAGARRNEPPPQRPQRTLDPRQPRGEAPADPQPPYDGPKTGH